MGERPLLNLGQHVAELQDRAPSAQLDRAEGRARLLAAEIPASRPLARRLGVVLAVAASLAALAVVLLLRPGDPLRFELVAGSTGQAGVVGAWIAAPASEARPIRFSDGSLLRLAPGGRARVTAVDGDGAEVALERGTLDVSVVHRAHTRWKVRVGPFQVHVIGTRFDLRWDPVSEQLDVALREGAITVSGPIVGEARAVRAGERLSISTTRSTLEVTAIDGARTDVATDPPGPPIAAPDPRAPPPNAALDPPAEHVAPPGVTAPSVAAPSPAPPGVAAPSAEPPPPPPPPAGPPAAETRPPDATASPAAPPSLGWRALALDARYKEALAAAEREGFDTICSSASVGDLQSLSYAARLGGSAARAAQALTVLRHRFPGSAEAGAAAFMLGRMAQDGAHDQAGAAGWFQRYLSEQPGGAFAADAAGRLVEAEDRRGDAAGARRAATRYLTLYPGGPHAAYARGVLSRPESGGASTPPAP